MAMSIVIPDTDWSSQTVTLGQTSFIIELKYKARPKRWYLTLKDSDGTVLLTEKKVVTNMNLTGLYEIEGLYGDIFCERIYGESAYPERDNFGRDKEFELKYYTEDEVNLLIGLGE